jgi:3-isopropylmalate dehydrogenase
VPGDPRLKDANIERGLLLKLRFALDHYVNLRPSKLYPGRRALADPGRSTSSSCARARRALRRQRRIDPHRYAARGRQRDERQHGVRHRTRRALRLRPAEKRRKKLTLVHKTNVLVHAGGMWKRIVDAVASEHPESP